MFKIGDSVFCKSNFQAPELQFEYPYEVANIRINHAREEQIWLNGMDKWYTSRRFKLNNQPKNVETTSDEFFKDPAVISVLDDMTKNSVVTTEWTDKHYDFSYQLTRQDIENGFVKVDPYFVSKQWKIGSKDDSGALWHCFKTIARFGEKNSKEREIRALYAQIKRLAELEGIEL